MAGLLVGVVAFAAHSGAATADDGVDAPVPPTDVTAVPADGAVRLDWTSSASAAGGRVIHYVVTRWPGGQQTRVAASNRPVVVAAPNDEPVSFTVASWDPRDGRVGEASAPTAAVTPRPMAVVLAGDPRRGADVVVDPTVRFDFTTSVPVGYLDCWPRHLQADCTPTSFTLRHLRQGQHGVSINLGDVLGRSSDALLLDVVVPRTMTGLVDRGWRTSGEDELGAGSWAQTRARGATATYQPPAGAVPFTRWVSLVARTGRGQGAVEVFLDGRLVGAADLGALPGARRDVVSVRLHRPRIFSRGKIDVRVVSRGEPVRLYGVGFSQ